MTKTDALARRLDAIDVMLQQILDKLDDGTPAPATNGGSSNASRTKAARWLDFVKFGGDCDGCGAAIPRGKTRAWYQPADHRKAKLFCERCGPPASP